MQPPNFVTSGFNFKVGDLYVRAMRGVPRGRPRYCVDLVYADGTYSVFMQDISLTGKIYRYKGARWRRKFIAWTLEYEHENRKVRGHSGN